jgi:hypothetical protein
VPELASIGHSVRGDGCRWRGTGRCQLATDRAGQLVGLEEIDGDRQLALIALDGDGDRRQLF